MNGGTRIWENEGWGVKWDGHILWESIKRMIPRSKYGNGNECGNEGYKMRMRIIGKMHHG